MFKPPGFNGRCLLATLAAGLLLNGSAMAAKGGKPKPPPEPPPPSLEYALTVLPAIDGFTSWTPLGMNDHGDVVGVAGGADDGHQRGVLCTRYGEAVDLDDVITLPTGVVRVSVAEDISNEGWIAGTVTVLDPDGKYRMHAFRCQADLEGELAITGFMDLGAPAGFTWTYGQAINNLGEVAVDAENDGSSVMGGFICTAAGGWIQVPGTLVARDINNAGEVASWIYVDGQPHACRYASQEDDLDDLGLLSRGVWSRGYAINGSGQVAGSAATKASSGERAFRYTDGVGMKNLGVLPIEGRSVTTYSVARAINALGEVVGTSGNATSGIAGAFLYTDSDGLLDLAELIVAPPDGFDANSLQVEAINDVSEVCGVANVDGVPRAVLLAPIE